MHPYLGRQSFLIVYREHFGRQISVGDTGAFVGYLVVVDGDEVGFAVGDLVTTVGFGDGDLVGPEVWGRVVDRRVGFGVFLVGDLKVGGVGF